MFANLGIIGELDKVLSVKSDTARTIMSYLGFFQVGRMLSRLSSEKKRGVSASSPIMALMLFRICGQSVGAISADGFHGLLDTGKNCFYRLVNSERVNWRGLLLSMACRFQAIIRKEGAVETNAPCCYIVDDTTTREDRHAHRGPEPPMPYPARTAITHTMMPRSSLIRR